MNVAQKTQFALVGLLVLASAACGGDDGEGSSSAAPAPDVQEVAACLEAGGMTTSTESVIPDETRELLGIKDSLTLSGDGDVVGLGSITWYADADTAAEAHEAGAAVRTEDVAREVDGTIAWDYAGADAASALIRDCLAAGS